MKSGKGHQQWSLIDKNCQRQWLEGQLWSNHLYPTVFCGWPRKINGFPSQAHSSSSYLNQTSSNTHTHKKNIPTRRKSNCPICEDLTWFVYYVSIFLLFGCYQTRPIDCSLWASGLICFVSPSPRLQYVAQWNPKRCTSAGLNGQPTWGLPGQKMNLSSRR